MGDFMCHSSQLTAALQGNGEYDFNPCYTHIAPLIARADFAFGNLETVLAGREQRYTGYPAFNSPDSYARALQEAGFDALTTANNHSFDRQYAGIKRTIHVLDGLNIPHTGTTYAQERRSKPLVINVRGIRIALLAYTYGLNQGALPQQYSTTVNIIDSAAIRSDIQSLQSLALHERPDIILVSLHWGSEYQLQPRPEQRRFADWLMRVGAHAVLGAHPHVVQTVEHRVVVRVLEQTLDTVMFPVVYSMGNFISGQRTKPREAGVVIWLDIEKQCPSGKTKIVGLGYTPTYVEKRYHRGKSEYRVLNVPRALRELEQDPQAYSASVARRLHEVMQHIRKQCATPTATFRLVE
ncbi:MAG: CapA family protein [Candidatus Kapabacteria bacterium]|nr:CapA family protein [Candidatus Kapabacteria bacterium]